MVTKLTLFLLIFSSSILANSILDHAVPMREQVKLVLWHEGIQKPKPLKIQDVMNYTLPSEIIVPLKELEE